MKEDTIKFSEEFPYLRINDVVPHFDPKPFSYEFLGDSTCRPTISYYGMTIEDIYYYIGSYIIEDYDELEELTDDQREVIEELTRLNSRQKKELMYLFRFLEGLNREQLSKVLY